MSSESGYTGGASIVSEGSNQSFVMEVKTKGHKVQSYNVTKLSYKWFKKIIEWQHTKSPKNVLNKNVQREDDI